MIRVFHGADGPRMELRGDNNCFKPSPRLRILEDMLADPKHQAMPVMWQLPICGAFVGIELHKARASGIQFACDFADRELLLFEGRTSPIRKCFPIDVT